MLPIVEIFVLRTSYYPSDILHQAGPNPGPRATCGPRHHLLWLVSHLLVTIACSLRLCKLFPLGGSGKLVYYYMVRGTAAVRRIHAGAAL